MNPYSFTVSLRLSGARFDPDSASTQLGMVPKWKHVSGEKRIAPSGRELSGFYETNACSYLLCQKRVGSLSEFISEQVSMLEEKSVSFRQIAESGGKAEFFVGLYVSGNSGEVIRYNLLERLGALGIDLSLDIYG
jgi:hypothetical protein